MTYTKQTWTDGPGATPLSAARLSHIESGIEAANAASLLMPTGAIAESGSRAYGTPGNVTLASGRLHLAALPLLAGQVVTSLTCASGGTQANSPTHWWFALYSPALALLRQTADQTTTPWGFTQPVTLALSSPYTVPTSGLYYAGVMVTAATPPNISAQANTATALMGLAPILGGSSTTGLTTTAPATAAALTAVANTPYFYAS